MDQQPPRGRDTSAIPITPKLVFGVVIMALGLLFTLDNLGVLDAGDFLRFWPAALIAVGVVKLMDCWPRGSSCTGAFVLILIGSGLLLSNLGWLRFDILFPLGLFTLGAYIVFRAVVRPKVRGGRQRSTQKVSGFAFLGGVSRTNRSEDFQGGDLSAFMGGCEVDLRDAKIVGGEAVIDTFAMMGGIEIRVPEDWVVDSRGLAVMGAYEDNTRGPQDSEQRLVLTGLAIMGGVEIKN